MQRLSGSLYNLPIFSLRTGHQVGTALRPLINPKNLKIEAWFAESIFERGQLLLPVTEIREIGKQGIAVNDRDAITPAEDLVRLQGLLTIDFQLVGKKVFTENKVRVGKVSDYSADLESFLIHRLYATAALFKQITSEQRIITRQQIVEINERKIIVRDTDVKATSLFKAPRPAPAPEA